jgi:SAM-dependent methyltransferase
MEQRTNPGHLERLRAAEIATVRSWFAPGARVLEIGGGNGYQASLIASWGCVVESIDLAGRRPWSVQYHPVGNFDGSMIPYPDACFDIVYSSHVLEHVANLSALVADTRRVLRPDGRAVHVVPTSAWRFWTSLAHYPYLLKYALLKEMPMPDLEKAPDVTTVLRGRGLGFVVKRALSAGPHGAYRNAAVELVAFSEPRWRRVFARHGFAVDDAYSAGPFHTGYCLMPRLDIDARRRLARLLGATSKAYVLSPKSRLS